MAGAGLAFGAGIPLALLLFMWWTLLIGDLAAQAGATGQLVPGMRLCALRIAVAAVLFASVLMALVMGAPLGRAGWVLAVTA